MEFYIAATFTILLPMSLVTSWSLPSCNSAKNFTLSCLLNETEVLYSKSLSILGIDRSSSNNPISAQICDICRQFSNSKECLSVLSKSCGTHDILGFVQETKIPYLGTVSSFCAYKDIIYDVHMNENCYSGISVNLRKCFEVLQREATCSAAGRGFTCSVKMAEVYCPYLFSKAGSHRLQSHLFLKVLEPMMDRLNCFNESEQPIVKIYPDMKNLWISETNITTGLDQFTAEFAEAEPVNSTSKRFPSFILFIYMGIILLESHHN